MRAQCPASVRHVRYFSNRGQPGESDNRIRIGRQRPKAPPPPREADRLRPPPHSCRYREIASPQRQSRSGKCNEAMPLLPQRRCWFSRRCPPKPKCSKRAVKRCKGSRKSIHLTWQDATASIMRGLRAGPDKAREPKMSPPAIQARRLRWHNGRHRRLTQRICCCPAAKALLRQCRVPAGITGQWKSRSEPDRSRPLHCKSPSPCLALTRALVIHSPGDREAG